MLSSTSPERSLDLDIGPSTISAFSIPARDERNERDDADRYKDSLGEAVYEGRENKNGTAQAAPAPVKTTETIWQETPIEVARDHSTDFLRCLVRKSCDDRNPQNLDYLCGGVERRVHVIRRVSGTNAKPCRR